jgi:hypothetical protein
MRDTDTPASVSSSTRPTADRPVRYAVQMPIEGSIDSIEAAVEKLLACDMSELRRARRHHRRALSALENGSYDTLSDPKRSELVRRLRIDLEALDRAIHQAGASSASSAPESPDAPSSPSIGPASGDGSGREAGRSGWSLPVWR